MGRGDYFKLESARLRKGATPPETAKSQRDQLTELGSTEFESWAKEGFEMATVLLYRNSGLIESAMK